MRAKPPRSTAVADPKTTRVSVSFPSDVYETLEQLARDQKVSVAWVVRDAAEKYLDQRWPLLGQRHD